MFFLSFFFHFSFLSIPSLSSVSGRNGREFGKTPTFKISQWGCPLFPEWKWTYFPVPGGEWEWKWTYFPVPGGEWEWKWTSFPVPGGEWEWKWTRRLWHGHTLNNEKYDVHATTR
jgi:hypothetical protein